MAKRTLRKRSVSKKIKPRSKRRTRSKQLRSTGNRMSDKALSRTRSKQKKSKRRGKILKGGVKVKQTPEKLPIGSTRVPPSQAVLQAARNQKMDKKNRNKRNSLQQNFRSVAKRATQQSRRAKELANRMSRRPLPVTPNITPSQQMEMDAAAMREREHIEKGFNRPRFTISPGSGPLGGVMQLGTDAMQEILVNPVADAVKTPFNVAHNLSRRAAGTIARGIEDPRAAAMGVRDNLILGGQYAAYPLVRGAEYVTGEDIEALDELRKLRIRQANEITRIIRKTTERVRNRGIEGAQKASTALAAALRNYELGDPSSQAHPI